ncbi:MAG: transposase [Chloroflexi bacterium]|nr:transposase [Chloroflexota bacterium]
MARDSHPKFDPQQHHRRSIRVKGYDYTEPGAYFVTIVTYRRDPLFGKIENGIMLLNDFGKIADECWRAIPEHFPTVELGVHMIMPNHVHGVIGIRADVSISNGIVAQHVGATDADNDMDLTRRGAIYRAPTDNVEQFGKPIKGSLPTIVRTYKAAVTRIIAREHNATGIWQRNYYERIIRNADEANRIHLYIEANPAQWDDDDENPSNNRG